LDEVLGGLNGGTIAFPCQEGGVLMLDNMLAAPPRSTFTGKRKVIVAMAEGHGAG